MCGRAKKLHKCIRLGKKSNCFSMFDLFFKLLLVQQVQLKCVPNMVGMGGVGGSLIHFRWAVRGGLTSHWTTCMSGRGEALCSLIET